MMQARLHHVAGDTGPNVVFIHGFGADRLAWLAVAPMLGAVARIWAVDLPGHGTAGDAVGDGRAATLAAAVQVALAEIAGPVHLVGHSLGGLVALHMVAMEPTRFCILALIAPAGVQSPANAPFLWALPDVRTTDQAHALLLQMVVRPRHVAPAMVEHVRSAVSYPHRRAGLVTIAGALIAETPLPLARLDGLTVLWGAEDRIVPPPAGLHTPPIPGVGHIPQIEAASAVQRALRTEIARITAEAPIAATHAPPPHP